MRMDIGETDPLKTRDVLRYGSGRDAKGGCEKV